MSQSIRISDALYAAAATEADLMNRSLAQQIEHWATVGRALEIAGVTHSRMRALASKQFDPVLFAAKRDYQSASREMVSSGQKSAEEMFLISRGDAQKAVLTFPQKLSW